MHYCRRIVDSVIKEPLLFSALVLEDYGKDSLRLAVIVAELVTKGLLLAPLFASVALVKRSRVEIFTYKFLRSIYTYTYIYIYNYSIGSA